MEYSEKALKILSTAKKLFAEKGFKTVTTKEIAKKADVNEVTIFRQFKNKENLFEQVLIYYKPKPNFEKFINPKDNNLENFLIGISEIINNIFTSGFDVFKIEMFERKRTKHNREISRLPNEIKIKMQEYLTSIHKMNNEEAELYSVSFMSAVFGVCSNEYFSQVYNPPADLDKCLKLVVDKFK